METFLTKTMTIVALICFLVVGAAATAILGRDSVPSGPPQLAAASTAVVQALYDAADSAWLLRLIRPVWETSERYCLEVPECRQLKSRRWEHRVILESCVTHDPDTAAIALHDHLATTANNISKAMGGGALFALEG